MTPDQRRQLALSAERDQWHQAVADSFRHGYAAGRAEGAGGWTTADLMNAYLAGRRAAKRHRTAWDAGYAAALDRLADLIGGRAFPDQPTEAEVRRWTRHHPDCHIGTHGGRRPCKRLGCLPGGREEFAKPAPWDRAGVAP